MYPVHSKNWNCSDSGVQFQLGGGGLREPHLKTHARDTSLLPGGGGGVGLGWSGGIRPRNFWKSGGLEMVFSMFSEKTQPGYGVKRQVLLVLTACTCTPPTKKKKVQGGLGAKS